ncbi:MAG: cytidine deaminase [Acetobacteraceae bacterium]
MPGPCWSPPRRARRPRRLTEFLAAALPLAPEDDALVEAAFAALRQHFHPERHRLAAAARDRAGTIFTGLHLGATVGRLSICAEATALGRALIEGHGGVAAIVAVRQPKPGEDATEPAVVPPCGACREMLIDHARDAMVILPGPGGLVRLPATLLLPLPYQR